MIPSSEDTYPKVYLYRRLVQAKLFIDVHFAERIDLENIADEATLSKFHFVRLFKKAYGKSPHQYLMSVRLDRAKQLLGSGKSITDVCHEVGFESLSSFTGLFKKKVGNSPSIFQLRKLQSLASQHDKPLTFVPHCFAAAKGWIPAVGEKKQF